MSLSYLLANIILQTYIKTSTPEFATPHLWLHVGDPGAAGTSNVAQTDVPANIIRKAIIAADPAQAGGGADLEQVIKNTAEVGWTGAEIAIGQNITHFTIWDAATAGNLLFEAAIGTPKTTGSDGVTIAIAALEVALGVYMKQP